MAYYKNPNLLFPGRGEPFDSAYPPGHPSPHAGIYICLGCGHEIGIARNHELPSQNHHLHNSAQGHIRWQLAVGTNSNT